MRKLAMLVLLAAVFGFGVGSFVSPAYAEPPDPCIFDF